VERERDMIARFVWLPLAAAVMLGCSSADPIDRVPTSPTECRNSTGAVVPCDIALDQAGGFSLTLVGRSCDATNNEVIIDEPLVTDPVVTSNGCNEPVGTVWTYSGTTTATPMPAGTVIDLTIIADQFANPPGLRVTDIPATATTPRAWRLDFEDGADQDYNDIVLLLQQVPAAAAGVRAQ
jgi:hypothetical protein